MTTTTASPAAPAVPAYVTCQSNAACVTAPTLLVWAYHPTEVGIDGILTCQPHVRAARGTLGRRTSAIMFTTALRGA